MRSFQMARGFGALSVLTLAGVAVLVFHSAALAQQSKPDTDDADQAAPEPEAAAQEKAAPAAADDSAAKPAAPQELPPDYAPPPGYGPRGNRPPPPPPGYGPGYRDDYYGAPPYPPPRYYRPRYYQPRPIRYYPEPMTYRPFFFGVGLGAGGVGLFPEEGYGENVARAGMSYNVHFGFGVLPRWSIVLAGDGAFAYFDGYDISQSVWSIGPQVFLNKKVYLRLGIGVATKSVDLDSSYDYYSYNVSTHSGMGWTAAVGVEFMQSYHVALGLEAAATYGHYQEIDLVSGSRDNGTIGINFMLNLF
jgi:hypothetical protein